MTAPVVSPPGWSNGEKPSKSFSKKERYLRIAALLLLCGMVWYFSFDQGRGTAKSRLARLERENISLREQLILAEADLSVVSRQLAE
ncbi:MAG: hypothetical protein LBJ64_11100, partial [Deltaproteobacteria bacterium]|nr:hypothetical protein [Deltaproteobacteria bacterium]